MLEAAEVATGREAVERIASAVGISRAAAAGTEMLSVVGLVDTTGPAHEQAVTADLPVWGRGAGAAEVAVVSVAVVGGEDRRTRT